MLGPVQVRNKRDTLHRDGPMLGILHARVQNEHLESNEGIAPGLSAGELSRLLEEYRIDPTKLNQLALEYDVGADKLRRLVRYVAAPTYLQ